MKIRRWITLLASAGSPCDAADLGRLRRDRRLARVEVGGTREDVPDAGRTHRFGLGSVGSVATAPENRV